MYAMRPLINMRPFQKRKLEHLGMQGMCEVKYNVHNSRFGNKNSGYDNANWLIPKSEQINIELFEQAPTNNFALNEAPEITEDAPF